ncbi:NACHT and WD40 repeat domain-containing protein [Streptomyces poonensis]|nr:NACHT domain-containing protein [Streptomyces poonensis]
MVWTSNRLSDRRVRTGLFVALGLVSLGIVVLSLSKGATRGNEIAGIAGALIGAAGLAVSVADFLRGDAAPPPGPAALADDLAQTLRDQWIREAESRNLRNPRVLPLEWSATERDVSDRLGALVPSGQSIPDAGRGFGGQVPGARQAGSYPTAPGQPARVVRLRLDGRLDGQFDDAADRLAAGYGRVGSGRLVVLGEPGAGKTVLALMLTLGLLADGRREPGGPVPVLVPVSTWDPICTSLDDWLVRRLAEAYYAGRTEIPYTLLRHGLLLPVLDGLDEIPEAARRTAVRALNHALGLERPVILTCRSVEYEDVLRAGSPALHRAPVVEITPVGAEDAVRYLTDVSWPDGTDWEPVYQQLRTAPDSSLARALSTPLMISLARTVYERCGGEPGELADATRFGSRHAVEDHLTERFVDAAYTSDPLPSGRPADSEGGTGPDPQKAREWLTFLALYLHRHRERDLSWWLMSERLRSPWAGPGIGLAFGAFFWVLAVVAMSSLGMAGEGGFDVLAVGALLGACFAVLTMLIWYGTAGRPPGRLSLARRGAIPRFRKGFRTGLALTLFPAGSIAWGMALFAANDGWRTDQVALLHDAVMISLALVLIIGCGLAVHECLDAPPGHAAQADPAGSLRDDRRSALVGALATGAVVGAGAFPCLVLCRWAVDVLLTGVNGWHHEPPLADLLTARMRREASQFGYHPPDGSPPLVVFLTQCFLLPGLVTALLVLLSRAWTRFVLLRLAAAARGWLPWRLMGFLADARARGVLRQSGGQYQFRHIRLQETLVSRLPVSTGDSLRSPGGPVRRRWPGLLGTSVSATAAVLAVVLSGYATSQDDSSTAHFLVDHDVHVLRFDDDTLLASDGERLSRWNMETYRPDTSRPAVRQQLITDLGQRFSAPAVRKELRALEADHAEVADLRTGERLGELPSDWYEDLSWVGDSHPAVLLDTCEASHVWDLESGRVISSSADHSPDGCPGSNRFSLLSPDRRLLAKDLDDSDGLRPRVVLQDWATGRSTRRIDVYRYDAAALEALAFSSDSRLLATAHASGHIHLWDTHTGSHRDELTGHDPLHVISGLTLNHDATLLAAASDDGNMRVWELDGR